MESYPLPHQKDNSLLGGTGWSGGESSLTLELQDLYQNGKIREGYELCRRFIVDPTKSVRTHVRRLVGLRALPLFSPHGSDWRQDAYRLLVGSLKDPSADINSRKESLSALVGLRAPNRMIYGVGPTEF